MTKAQYIKTGSDESYTYPSLVEPILDKIRERFPDKEMITVWCPFDMTEDNEELGLFRSNYVDLLEKSGFNVIASHLATGQDFFAYEPDEDYDVIVSNPPFKNKKEFFERALSLNKPFALVSTASWLNDGGLFKLFDNQDKPLQLFMPDKRSKFFNKDGCIGKQPSFKAIYYCYDFLVDNDIQWFELDRSLDS